MNSGCKINCNSCFKGICNIWIGLAFTFPISPCQSRWNVTKLCVNLPTATATGHLSPSAQAVHRSTAMPSPSPLGAARPKLTATADQRRRKAGASQLEFDAPKTIGRFKGGVWIIFTSQYMQKNEKKIPRFFGGIISVSRQFFRTPKKPSSIVVGFGPEQIKAAKPWAFTNI